MTGSDDSDQYDYTHDGKHYEYTVGDSDDSGPSMVHQNCLVDDPANDDGMVAVVPVKELQALVDEWEDFAEPNGWDGYSNGVRDATESCAKELQERIDKHRGDSND